MRETTPETEDSPKNGQFPFRSISEALKKDHDDLRSMFSVLKDQKASYATKKKVYSDFSILLKSHAKSEERAVYAVCLQKTGRQIEVYEGYEEHALMDSIMRRIARTRNPEQWIARVKVLVETLEHHLTEEEKVFLPAFLREIKEVDELKMISAFIRLRVNSPFKTSTKHPGVLAESSAMH